MKVNLMVDGKLHCTCEEYEVEDHIDALFGSDWQWERGGMSRVEGYDGRVLAEVVPVEYYDYTHEQVRELVAAARDFYLEWSESINATDPDAEGYDIINRLGRALEPFEEDSNGN